MKKVASAKHARRELDILNYFRAQKRVFQRDVIED